MAAATRLRTGLQRQVLTFYRSALRVVASKRSQDVDPRSVAALKAHARAKIEQHKHVNPHNFMVSHQRTHEAIVCNLLRITATIYSLGIVIQLIEHLLRVGHRQLELIRSQSVSGVSVQGLETRSVQDEHR
jgi:hypothetical protein